MDHWLDRHIAEQAGNAAIIAGCPEYSEADEVADALIDRREAAGFSREESRVLLAELCAAHTGSRLASALVYNGFATEAQAERSSGAQS